MKDCEEKLREYEDAIRELKQTVDSCRIRIYELERSKLSINKVIQRKEDLNLVLQIIKCYPTENGVVIEVEQEKEESK